MTQLWVVSSAQKRLELGTQCQLAVGLVLDGNSALGTDMMKSIKGIVRPALGTAVLALNACASYPSCVASALIRP
jgi:hypothetical protein